MESLANSMETLPSDRKFLNIIWNHMHKPSYQKLRPHLARNCDVSKITFYQLFMNHIIRMKEKFPETDGRLCRYCERPLTFIPPRQRSYKDKKEKNNYTNKRRNTIDTNLSIDCLNPSIGYTYENIVFSCGGCNHRKNAIMPADVLNILRVYEEVETENEKGKWIKVLGEDLVKVK